MEFAGPPHGYRILDVGCGVGRNYIELSKRGLLEGFSLYGVEIDSDTIKKTKQDVEEENKREHLNLPSMLVRGDAQMLPFPDESFDAIYANSIPAKDVSNWKDVFRVVKRNGAMRRSKKLKYLTLYVN